MSDAFPNPTVDLNLKEEIRATTSEFGCCVFGIRRAATDKDGKEYLVDVWPKRSVLKNTTFAELRETLWKRTNPALGDAAPLRDVREVKDRIHIIRDFHSRRPEEPLPFEERSVRDALGEAYRIADALELLHSKGRNHGNIAPHLLEQGRPSLLDSALDWTLDELRDGESDAYWRPGKAPELWFNYKAMSREADIYAFAASLAAWLFGRSAFANQREWTPIMWEQWARGPVECTYLLEQIDKKIAKTFGDLAECWSRALKKDPAARNVSAADFRKVLEIAEKRSGQLMITQLRSPSSSRTGSSTAAAVQERRKGDSSPFDREIAQHEPAPRQRIDRDIYNLSGEVIDNYKIGRQLGSGGMGIVYEATDTKVNRRVAFKVSNNPGNVEFERRFKSEAEAIKRLQHPNIPDFYHFGSDGRIHYLVMEFVQGASLYRIMEIKRGSPVDKSKDYEKATLDFHENYVRASIQTIIDLSGAVSAIHGVPFVHRDIKPSNIIINIDRRPKLIDFGLARDEKASGARTTSRGIGTEGYAPPEQKFGQSSSYKVDIYALGVTLYELLTLKMPFPEDSGGGGDTQRNPIALRQHNPRIPRKLDEIILRAIDFDPKRRWETAGELQTELREFLGVWKPEELRLCDPSSEPKKDTVIKKEAVEIKAPRVQATMPSIKAAKVPARQLESTRTQPRPNFAELNSDFSKHSDYSEEPYGYHATGEIDKRPCVMTVFSNEWLYARKGSRELLLRDIQIGEKIMKANGGEPDWRIDAPIYYKILSDDSIAVAHAAHAGGSVKSQVGGGMKFTVDRAYDHIFAYYETLALAQKHGLLHGYIESSDVFIRTNNGKIEARVAGYGRDWIARLKPEIVQKGTLRNTSAAADCRAGAEMLYAMLMGTTDEQELKQPAKLLFANLLEKYRELSKKRAGRLVASLRGDVRYTSPAKCAKYLRGYRFWIWRTIIGILAIGLAAAGCYIYVPEFKNPADKIVEEIAEKVLGKTYGWRVENVHGLELKFDKDNWNGSASFSVTGSPKSTKEEFVQVSIRLNPERSWLKIKVDGDEGNNFTLNETQTFNVTIEPDGEPKEDGGIIKTEIMIQPLKGRDAATSLKLNAEIVKKPPPIPIESPKPKIDWKVSTESIGFIYNKSNGNAESKTFILDASDDLTIRIEAPSWLEIDGRESDQSVHIVKDKKKTITVRSKAGNEKKDGSINLTASDIASTPALKIAVTNEVEFVPPPDPIQLYTLAMKAYFTQARSEDTLNTLILGLEKAKNAAIEVGDMVAWNQIRVDLSKAYFTRAKESKSPQDFKESFDNINFGVRDDKGTDRSGSGAPHVVFNKITRQAFRLVETVADNESITIGLVDKVAPDGQYSSREDDDVTSTSVFPMPKLLYLANNAVNARLLVSCAFFYGLGTPLLLKHRPIDVPSIVSNRLYYCFSVPFLHRNAIAHLLKLPIECERKDISQLLEIANIGTPEHYIFVPDESEWEYNILQLNHFRSSLSHELGRPIWLESMVGNREAEWCTIDLNRLSERLSDEQKKEIAKLIYVARGGGDNKNRAYGYTRRVAQPSDPDRGRRVILRVALQLQSLE